MEFRLLGPVEWRTGGEPVRLRRRERSLLAVLVLENDHVVPVDRLVDLLWDDDPPPHARSAVHSHVSRIRAVLKAADPADGVRLVTQGDGYRLHVPANSVDVFRFRAMLDQARQVDADAERADALRAALRVWRGPPLAGTTGRLRERFSASLEELRAAALEDRIDADLGLGRHAEILSELTRLVADHPLRERLRGQHMLALYRCGRRADALDAYRRTRRFLAAELGIEPGPDLHDLEQAILRDDPALAPPAPPAAPAAPAAAAAPVEPAAAPAPAQLPADVTAFVGRAACLDELDALASGERDTVVIVAITGPAGVGKSALAVHGAHRVRDRFPDAQLYIDLGGYGAGPPLRPIEVLAQFLRALGVPAAQVPTDEREAAGLYRSLLDSRRTLLILDNAHHPAQVRPLLPGSPGCLVLVTSRDSLGGLVARDGARRIALDVLTPDEAGALLTRVLGDERVGAEPAAAAELAGLCAYLPLALRIAAANVTVDPPHTIAGYLNRMRSGSRLAALEVTGDEQAAVRAAFDLSYEVLPAPARRLFRLLGLVPARDVTAASAAALADLGEPRAARLLDRLAGAHLIAEPVPGRFALHDLLRLYASELTHRDDPPPDRAAATARLYDHYLATIDAAARTLYPELLRLPADPRETADFADPTAANAWLDAERANLLAAITHAAESGPRPMAWRLTDALRGYFYLRVHIVDGLAAAGSALAAARAEGDPAAQAAAHLGYATLLWRQGRHELAVEHNAEVLALSQEAGWVEGEGGALGTLGILYAERGDLPASVEYLARAAAFNRDIGRPAGEVVNLGNLALVYWQLGRLRQAAEHHGRALALYRELGSRLGPANLLGNLGQIHHALGCPDRALEHLTEAQALAREVGNRGNEADVRHSLAVVYRDTGRHAEAVEEAETALALAREMGYPDVTADALNTLGTLLRAGGKPAMALDRHERALEIARKGGARYLEAEILTELAVTTGRPGPAEEALGIARAAGYRMLEGHALAALAATTADTDPAGAADHARAALAVHEETGHRLGQARARLLLGDREAALAIFAEVGATAPG